MSAKLLGLRIRERRKALGMKQSELARQCGISPSYLNLIEHNRRAVAGKLLLDIASALGLSVAELSDDSDGVLARTISAALRGDVVVESDRVFELIGRFPGWSRLIASMQQRIDTLEQTAAALSDRLAHDPYLAETLHEILSSVTAIHATAAILVQTEGMEPLQQRRFQANIHQESARLSDLSRGLAVFFDRLSEDQVAHATPLDELEAFLARHDFHFPGIEDGSATAESLISAADELVSRASRLLAGEMLARYRADVGAMPLEPFVAAAQECRFDPLQLARRFDIGFDAVCRRLAFLPPGRGLPDFGLITCDGTGAVLLRKPLAGFSLPRYGAACPLWPLYQAISRPHVPVSARLETPERQRFSAIAHSRYVTPQALLPVQRATMLFCHDGSAMPVVGPDIPVGLSCRICPRNDCTARREPSLQADQAGMEGAAVVPVARP